MLKKKNRAFSALRFANGTFRPTGGHQLGSLLKTNHDKEAAELEIANSDLFDKSDSATFLEQYGFNEQAIPYYQKALDDAPEDKAIRNKFCKLLLSLAIYAKDSKDDFRAIELLKQALALSSQHLQCTEDPSVRNELREAYLRTENYEQADRLNRLGINGSEPK